jgi:hypothetical protein
MRRFVTLAASTALFAALAMAGSWTGRLVDSACYEQQKADPTKTPSACPVTGSTTEFAISASGKMLKLDDAGNAKAAEALKNRADRTDPNAPPTTMVSAKITGTLEGDTVKVETIDVQ